MQVGFSFQFPHCQRPVAVRILVPLPEHRPRIVTNFTYMCTGELPPMDMMHALRVNTSELAFNDPSEARAAGLLPFVETSIVRVDKDALLEIGSSTTKTIFGGFVPDERVALAPGSAARGGIAATMSQLKAGTMLVSNLGMPNSNASRYLLLLRDASNEPAQLEELEDFLPLGMVTSGLAELLAAAKGTIVQPRTLTPVKKIALSGCTLEFEYQQLLATSTAVATATQQQSSDAPGEPRQRVAGRTRRRGEDDDGGRDEDLDEENNQGEQKGFFQFSARYPTAAGDKAAMSGNALKRVRAEAMVMGEDGVPELRTTAVARGGEFGSDGEDEESRHFNFFDAQEAAFMNDIDLIKDTQRTRIHNKMRRLGKQHSRTSGTSAKALTKQVMRKISGKSTKSNASTRASDKKKTTSKRY